jgi:hypothetical protein
MLHAMDGILVTLKNLSFVQMVCAWLFVACYALALGGMLGPKGRLRAGLLAALASVVFAGFADQWVHGALLVMFAIAGMGLFVVLAWALAQTSAWLLINRHPAAAPNAAPRAPAVPATAPAGALGALQRSRVAP